MKSPKSHAMLFFCVSAAIFAFAGGSKAVGEAVAAPAVGEQIYSRNCASCHGPARGGGPFGPAVSGKAFQEKWTTNGRDALERYMAQAMPPGNPGGLSTKDYHGLAAFLLPSRSASGKGAKADAASAKAGEWMLSNESNTDTVYQAAVQARRQALAKLSTVTDATLRDPPAEDWLAIRRTYDSFGFSPLQTIDRHNVGNLQVAWSLALRMGSGNEITPLAHDGVLFVNSSGTVLALNATSGDVLWTFNRPAEVTQLGPPVTQPKGMAVYGDSLLVPTSDNHILALEMRTGKLIWDTVVAPSGGSLRLDAAPIVVRGKVIEGMSGCVMSGGCFIVALDAATGKEVWRLGTIAKSGTKDGDSWGGLPDDERVGGSIWDTASYDPVTNLIYVGVGQTYHIAPLMDAKRRGAANAALYTDSTLAIDPDTGKLVWHYQHMERDVWDLDWAFERLVMTLPGQFGPQRVVATMGKLGILDVLDARTGRYIFSQDLGYQNLVTNIDPATGRKMTDPALEPEDNKVKRMCPYAIGVRNWPATSFDPRTNKLYIPYMRSCEDFVWKRGDSRIDISFGIKPPEGPNRNTGGLAALDLVERKLSWKSERRGPILSAALATAGGVVFYDGMDRFFQASDSETGELLWQLRLDQIASATPITFAAGGTQYVAVTTGTGNPIEVTTRALTPEIDAAGAGVRLWVFKLPDRPGPQSPDPR
jgi:alcohol dehydrogenase (cytochrome c)